LSNPGEKRLKRERAKPRLFAAEQIETTQQGERERGEGKLNYGVHLLSSREKDGSRAWVDLILLLPRVMAGFLRHMAAECVLI